MRKIPTIFERDWLGDKSRVLDKPNPLAQWVFDGEGVATRKYDGIPCLYDGHHWFTRRDLKEGQPEPPGYVLSDYDEETKKRTGWIPLNPDDPAHRFMIEATHRSTEGPTTGTYEFLGPKSQGNVEGVEAHMMLLHDSAETCLGVPLTFEGIRSWLYHRDIEGIVWHHPDGRMAKIKKRDFAFKRVPDA